MRRRFLLRVVVLGCFAIVVAQANDDSRVDRSSDRAPSQAVSAERAGEGTPDGSFDDQLLSPGDYTRTLEVDALRRSYSLHIPRKYDPQTPTPVVLAFHGGGGHAQSMARFSGLNSKSDEVGFMVVYPNGTGRLWGRLLTFNGGDCCGYAMRNEVDDVDFVRQILNDLGRVTRVDPKRVFATVMSNGGIMSHRIAAELSDRIAAIAPVGGPLEVSPLNPARPVSVMHFHGTADAFAPFDGGRGKGISGTNFNSVQNMIEAWVAVNGCNPEAVVQAFPDSADDNTTVTRKTYSGGKHGSEVVLIKIEGGGHTWPGVEPRVGMLGASTRDVSANDLMWEFFQQHPMRSDDSTTQPSTSRTN